MHNFLHLGGCNVMHMLTIEENIDLFPFNTFHLHGVARYFTSVTTTEDIQTLISSVVFKQHPCFILGGGSNILLKGNYDGLVIKNEIAGIEIVAEDDNNVVIQVGAGEVWHNLVMYCVQNNWGGVENLSLIPGTVGAAPMQNIGAYGVEIKNVLETVQAVQLSTGNVVSFTNEMCEFGYRESIFKHKVKNQYLISSVTLRLTKKNHRLNASYGAIQEVLHQTGISTPTIKSISDAVISIRSSKLPDPKVIGNAGSFFKNPSVSQAFFETIKEKHPYIPFFPAEQGLVKIPAGWLIEQSGWKGKTFDQIGVHKHQALVLVNYGGGKGEAIWNLALSIQASVKENFGIILHPEVNIIG